MVEYISTKSMIADGLIKPLKGQLFKTMMAIQTANIRQPSVRMNRMERNNLLSHITDCSNLQLFYLTNHLRATLQQLHLLSTAQIYRNLQPALQVKNFSLVFSFPTVNISAIVHYYYYFYYYSYSIAQALALYFTLFYNFGHWTNRITDFNKRVTSTAEGGHANIKKVIESTLGYLPEVVKAIREKVEDQLRKIHLQIRMRISEQL